MVVGVVVEGAALVVGPEGVHRLGGGARGEDAKDVVGLCFGGCGWVCVGWVGGGGRFYVCGGGSGDGCGWLGWVALAVRGRAGWPFSIWVYGGESQSRDSRCRPGPCAGRGCGWWWCWASAACGPPPPLPVGSRARACSPFRYIITYA